MDKRLVLLASIAILTLLAGCMGSGESSGGSKEPKVNSGQLTLTGTQSDLAQATTVETQVTVEIPLEFGNVIEIMVNITVNDGEEGTDPDQVGQITLAEVDGNATGTANGGSASFDTPFTTSITVKWDGTDYMAQRWNLNIPVTIAAGPDQWIGPFIWSGTPDRGFSYNLEITYQYHEDDV